VVIAATSRKGESEKSKAARDVAALTLFLAYCAYAKRQREARTESSSGRRSRRMTNATTRVESKGGDAKKKTKKNESVDQSSSNDGLGFMMKVQTKEVRDKALEDEKRVIAEREAERQRKEEAAKKEREAAESKAREAAEKEAKAKEAAEAAERKKVEAAEKKKKEAEAAKPRPTFRKPVASRKTGWQPVRNEAADKLREVIEARRLERRERLAEQVRLKKEQARAAEEAAQLRAEIIQAEENERRAMEEMKAQARAEEKAAAEEKARVLKAQREKEELATKRAQEADKQAREAEARRAKEAKAKADAAAAEQKAAAEKRKQAEEQAKTAREAKEKEAKAREKAMKDQEAARLKAIRAEERADYIEDLKWRAADAADSVVDGAYNKILSIKSVFTSKREKASAPKRAAPAAPKKIKKEAPKPAVKLAPPAKSQKTRTAAQSQGWSLPKIPTSLRLDAGGYATAGFATSLILASILSVGVRASRQKRARRRAERRARAEADKLKQKDRWVAAIDTDVVTAEAAERAARVAESQADADAQDADDSFDERAALQKAYDEFLRASKADKKM
jgi:hypothetical protein